MGGAPATEFFHAGFDRGSLVLPRGFRPASIAIIVHDAITVPEHAVDLGLQSGRAYRGRRRRGRRSGRGGSDCSCHRSHGIVAFYPVVFSSAIVWHAQATDLGGRYAYYGAWGTVAPPIGGRTNCCIGF